MITRISTTGNASPLFSKVSKGFSLVELLVVLVLMSLVAASISLVVLNRGDDLKSLANEVTQAMRLTQMRAMREGHSIQIELDLKSNRITFPDKIIDLPGEFHLTVKTTADQVIEEDLVGMTFFPDASSTGGYIQMESDEEIYEIMVIWMTGKIRVRQTSKST